MKQQVLMTMLFLAPVSSQQNC